jgi:phosphopantetheine adenylyltransferase
MQVSDILPKIETLRQSLEAADPNIEFHMRAINEDLRQYPELVFALTDEQIAPIYQSILKKTNTTITVKAAKKRGKNNLLDDGTSVADAL